MTKFSCIGSKFRSFKFKSYVTFNYRNYVFFNRTSATVGRLILIDFLFRFDRMSRWVHTEAHSESCFVGFAAVHGIGHFCVPGHD